MSWRPFPASVLPDVAGHGRGPRRLHFSPVERWRRPASGRSSTLSVPVTHAFVGNGIVNHNTINMPEEATVEDVEDLHVEAWRLGLKAVAIYRDNCKVGQPLSAQKKAAEPSLEGGRSSSRRPSASSSGSSSTSSCRSRSARSCRGPALEDVLVPGRRLPRLRDGRRVRGRPARRAVPQGGQAGSTLAGIMDAFAISVSHGLQYGVPLKAFVEMFTNMRFEPAGITDDPEIRLASSLVDYIFRRLAVEYLDLRRAGRHGDPHHRGAAPADAARRGGVVDRAGVVGRHRPAVARPEPRPDGAAAVRTARRPRRRRRRAARRRPGPPPSPKAPAASTPPTATAAGWRCSGPASCYVCSSCGATSGCS